MTEQDLAMVQNQPKYKFKTEMILEKNWQTPLENETLNLLD